MAVQIKDILNKMLSENPGMPRVSWEFKISSAWSKVNPENVANNSSPEKLVGGVLHVNAANSSWAQQINLLKPGIIMKLNAFVGESVISDIRLKTGFVRDDVKTAKEKPVRVCGICTVEYIGEESACPVCIRKNKLEKEIGLMRMVEKNNNTSLATARITMPGTTDVDLHRAKRNVIARKSDKAQRERRQNGRQKAN